MSNDYYARRLASRVFAAKYPIPVFANRIGEMMFELGLNPVEDTHKLAEYPDKYLMSFYNVGKAAVRAIRSEFGPYVAPQQSCNPLPPNARAAGETRARPWIDDPWYDLRPEQAWRAGWEAAVAAMRCPTPAMLEAAHEAYGGPIDHRICREAGVFPKAEYEWAFMALRAAILAMDPPA